VENQPEIDNYEEIPPIYLTQNITNMLVGVGNTKDTNTDEMHAYFISHPETGLK
jgi:hypothetical protein